MLEKVQKALRSLAHLFGIEKLSKYERDYIHSSNVHSSMYIGFITVGLEIWMLVRQILTKVYPKCLAGMGLFPAMVKYTTKFWLFLLVGQGMALFCMFCRYHKEEKMSKGWFFALFESGLLCILYTFVIRLETFIKVSEFVTPEMANIMNLLLVCIYICLFVFGLTISAYAIIRYKRNKRIVWIEYMVVILFGVIGVCFGSYVSYSDFWEGKQIICFMMMMVYIGFMLNYRPYITILGLFFSFLLFYRILLTYKSGVTFKPKEVEINGVIHYFTSGDTANYLTFLASLITICTAIYHGRLKEANESRSIYRMFGQTAEALATAIDAKDTYTHGHSTRVADYSLKIAKAVGKTEEECQKVYFAALLHDVGKIGVPDNIINKDQKLTDEEFAQIKMHPVYGNLILSQIRESPYLSQGALYHHERYDGRGYPTGLKGEAIPEIARIIAVADSYDAMTSKRSYRDPLPQQKVREEIYKGIGTQFDPKFARKMINLIDLDSAFIMQESAQRKDVEHKESLDCDQLYGAYTEGIKIDDKILRIRLYSKAKEGFPEDESLPSIILFDSLDSRVHLDDYRKKSLLYCEYARIRLDGEVFSQSIRSFEKTSKKGSELVQDLDENIIEKGQCYDIQVVRQKDHVLLRIMTSSQTQEITLALPDGIRFAYIALTGSNCLVSNIYKERDKDSVSKDYIKSIVPEISYIEGAPEGDLPNMQIEGWREKTTDGIPLKGKTQITFHTQSLPMSWLIWHCPFFVIFTSDNGLVSGNNYREFSLIRMDGEDTWSSNRAVNTIQTEISNDFTNWEEWKQKNKEGLDVTLSIYREGKTITMETENLGISMKVKTVINDEVSKFYFAITGDECAITNIRIS
ncbi:MAG: HD-GYP domain-containing protein [Treponema sp.]|nr:HD-GYP domain-containing protein [Treponema sp.]